MAGSYATAPDRTCVRIARSATLRRRFAQKKRDTGFCYPCPPTLLLPMSPADQTLATRLVETLVARALHDPPGSVRA